MTTVNVLVFPCGTELGLELADALGCSLHVNLFGASSREDHGSITYQKYQTLPLIDDPTFNVEFQALVVRWEIQVVFTTHDSVHLHLARYAGRFGIFLVNGNIDSAKMARSKRATYERFSDQPWVPKLYQAVSEINTWPICIKPDAGQGGQGVMRADSPVHALIQLEHIKTPLLCEYLPGIELTVDCFTNYLGSLIFIGPRTRQRLLGGISVTSERVESSFEIELIANHLNNSLVFRGAWFFQIKKDINGNWKILEFSCRLSSSSVVQRAAGVNLALLTVHDYMRQSLKIIAEPKVRKIVRRLSSRALIDYEFDKVYIDFDETLVFKGQAHPVAMNFIYEMLVRGKELFLVTRHEGDLNASLESAKIHSGIFTKIFHLKNSEKKSSVIIAPSIFVDNHFPERLDVSVNCGIPVFDVDALELLI